MTTVYGPSIPSNLVVASQIGCILDCDLTTGLQNGTGLAATDNTAILQEVLNSASATNPVHLLIDGGSLITGLFTAPNGYCIVEGIGPSSGFFVKSGSNSTGFGNKRGAPFEQQESGLPTPPQAGYVYLRNLLINGNMLGNSTSGNLKGVFPGNNPNAWFSPGTDLYVNIDLQNLAHVVIEDVVSVNSPLYALRISNCSDVSIVGYNADTSTNLTGQSDSCHISGPCDRFRIVNSTFNSGSDDTIAFNAPEGWTGDITNVLIDNCYSSGNSLVRLYAGNRTVANLVVNNMTGSSRRAAHIMGIQNVGSGGPIPPNGLIIAVDQVQDYEANNIRASLTSAAVGWVELCNSFGVMRMTNQIWDSPVTAIPFISLSNMQLNVSEVIVSNVTIQRTTRGNALGGALIDTTVNTGFAGSCNFKRVVIDGYDVMDQAGQTFSPLPYLLNIGTGNQIGELFIKSLDPTNITSLVDSTNGFTNITQVNGPGVLASGFQFPDSVMANNCMYISATGANAGKPCIKLAGTVHTLNIT